jgi:hypothetical protein
VPFPLSLSYFASRVALTAVPYLALAAVGIIQFRRDRTLSAALVVLGFAAAALSEALALFVSYGQSGSLIVRWRDLIMLWGDNFGPWVGAAGLLWHTLSSASPSPNNRWRGP